MKDYHCPLFSKDLGPTICFHQKQTLAQEAATAEEWKMIKSHINRLAHTGRTLRLGGWMETRNDSQLQQLAQPYCSFFFLWGGFAFQ